MSSLLTVVMPVFNTKADYLREAIASVLAQTFSDFKLFIVDDGSVNDIAEIVHEFHDSRIVFERFPKNQGIVAARNFAIDHSESEFIAFLDSDDYAYPDRFMLQIEYLNKHKDVGCLGTRVKVIGDDAAHFKSSGDIRLQNDKSLCSIENFLIFKSCCFILSSVMLRRQVLDKYQIRFQHKYEPAEDYGLYLELVGKTSFAMMDQVLSAYRYHFQNISHVDKSKQMMNGWQAQINVINKMFGMDVSLSQWQQSLSGSAFTSLNMTELKSVLLTFSELIAKMECSGISHKEICFLLKNRIRGFCYHSHGLGKQLLLMRSPTVSYFKFPWYWKLFCFVTRAF